MNIEEIDAIVIEELKRSYMMEHIASADLASREEKTTGEVLTPCVNTSKL